MTDWTTDVLVRDDLSMSETVSRRCSSHERDEERVSPELLSAQRVINDHYIPFSKNSRHEQARVIDYVKANHARRPQRETTELSQSPQDVSLQIPASLDSADDVGAKLVR